MAAKKVHPLRRLRPLLRRFERADQRLEVGGRQRVEQALIHRKVQHHLQAVAEIAEVLEALVRRHVGLREQHRIAAAPLQEVAHLVQELVVLVRDARARLCGRSGTAPRPSGTRTRQAAARTP